MKYLIGFILTASIAAFSAKAEELYAVDNSEIIDAGIHCQVEVVNTGSGAGIRFQIINNSSLSYGLSTVDSPWVPQFLNLEIFPVSEVPGSRKKGFWQQSLLGGDHPIGIKEIRPGDKIEGIYPLSEMYPQIEGFRKNHDIYLLWSFTLKLYNKADLIDGPSGFLTIPDGVGPKVKKQLGGFLKVPKPKS